MQNWLQHYSPTKDDPYWRASRLAARILIREQSGKPLSERDRRLARKLAITPGVSNRLIDQGLAFLRAPKSLSKKI